MTTPHSPQDWATYQWIEDAVRAYIRDHDQALDALAGVVDLQQVKAFTLERVPTAQPYGESLWQEVAVTDGRRLILWHGDDESEDETGEGNMFSSSVRTIPLSAVVDQGLRTRYRVEDGTRSLHAVMLYLSTQTPERSVSDIGEGTETKITQFVETYRFSKSVSDGGLAQMQRLMQFGRSMSTFAATAG